MAMVKRPRGTPHTTADQMSTSTLDPDAFLARKQEVDCIQQARVRVGAMCALHLFFPPVVSCIYASKTNNWAPTVAATAVAAITFCLDASTGSAFFTTVIPPITSASMFASRSEDARRKLGILMPEQADKLLREKGLY